MAIRALTRNLNPGEQKMSGNSDRSEFNPAGLATLIGSLPLSDHGEALEWIYSHTPDIPLWPQLPCNPLEGMLKQFVEGFPGIVEEGQRTFFDIHTESFEEDLLKFFEEYLIVSEDPDQLLSSRFQVSRERAGGLYLLMDETAKKSGVTAVKGQITGPFTLLTGLKDQDDRLAYYDPTIREIGVKGIAMKAGWQVKFLSRLGLPTLMFVDEPAFAGLGSSSFITISPDDLGQDMNEVFTAIKQNGGLAGVHVCANTDWNFILSLDLDILSFDAYGFFDRLITCKDQLYSFLNRGGIIAWGIVPTSEEDQISNETTESLTAMWEKQAVMLKGPGWDLPALLGRTIITPSCGTGALAPDFAKRVLELTRDLSAGLRKKYL